MNENISTEVTKDVVEGAIMGSGLRKGAVIFAAAGAVITLGYLTHKFILKPIVKKIKAKKIKKLDANKEVQEDNILEDDEDDGKEIKMIFDEEETD